MSTPEQPDTPPLTRKQLREIRNTGATPIITPAEAEAAAAADAPAAPEPVATEPVAAEPVAPVAPLPRPSEPAVVAPAPAADASIDLGVSPLTRRQARQQERIRTASVPVITPDFASQYAEATDAATSQVAEAPAAEEPVVAEPVTEEPVVTEPAVADQPVAAEPVDAEPVDEAVIDVLPEEPAAEEPADDAVIVAEPVTEPVADESVADESLAILQPEPAEEERPVVAAGFGAELLAGEPVRIDLPPTFDQLISRDATASGSAASPNALILSQTPSSGPLMAPIASTGEILITGTYELPEGLGSQGHAPGVADGKEADAVLIDGELPAHSSPTPIAASAAISTVKTDGEIIRPPAPEKGSKLMLTLAITAGALALALVGVLILAFVTGVFS